MSLMSKQRIEYEIDPNALRKYPTDEAQSSPANRAAVNTQVIDIAHTHHHYYHPSIFTRSSVSKEEQRAFIQGMLEADAILDRQKRQPKSKYPTGSTSKPVALSGKGSAPTMVLPTAVVGVSEGDAPTTTYLKDLLFEEPKRQNAFQYMKSLMRPKPTAQEDYGRVLINNNVDSIFGMTVLVDEVKGYDVEASQLIADMIQKNINGSFDAALPEQSLVTATDDAAQEFVSEVKETSKTLGVFVMKMFTDENGKPMIAYIMNEQRFNAQTVK